MIKSYFVDGIAKDQEWIIDHRDQLEEGMRQDMRDHGWIPVIDIPINITWDYNSDKDTFNFRMEAKGKRAGRKRALKSVGILSQEGIMVMSDSNGEQLSLSITG